MVIITAAGVLCSQKICEKSHHLYKFSLNAKFTSGYRISGEQKADQITTLTAIDNKPACCLNAMRGC